MKYLLLYYFEGSGGKFIANTLAYTQQVAFMNVNIMQAAQQAQDFDIIHQSIMKTVPDKEISHSWHKHEAGVVSMYGPPHNRMPSCGVGQYDDLIKLHNADSLWFPTTFHNPLKLPILKSCLKADQLFTVHINSTADFIDRAIRIKWPMMHQCLDLDLFRKFHENTQGLKFDFVLDNWDPRDRDQHYRLQELASALGCNLDLDAAAPYINRYLDFHS